MATTATPAAPKATAKKGAAKKTDGPSAVLFDVTQEQKRKTIDGVMEYVPLDQITVDPRNSRTDINEDSIRNLAYLLMTTGQITPAICRRRAEDDVNLFAGQRRLLAAKASHELAGQEIGDLDFRGLAPVVELVCILLNHDPSDAEVEQIEAQENNAREDLSRRDQQKQFDDAWKARTGMKEDERIASVCRGLGISGKKARALLAECKLPKEIAERVSERPTGRQLPPTLARKLADMAEVAPDLATRVANDISTADHRQRAQSDLGGFVHRSLAADDGSVYAVRIDEGAMLDGAKIIDDARKALKSEQLTQVAEVLARNTATVDEDDADDADEKKPAEDLSVDEQLSKLGKQAKSHELKITVTREMRDRANNGRYAWAFKRGQDYADGIWVVDPVFMIDIVSEQLKDAGKGDAREESYFKDAKLSDEELEAAKEAEKDRKAKEREQRQAAEDSNLGLGHDIAAKLVDPDEQMLDATRRIVCMLLAEQFGEIIAFGAGWTDRDRMQPVGDTERFEPRLTQAIVDAELQRALDDRDPMRGIMQMVTRLGAAFLLDPNGTTKGKALGSERMARKLRDALPGGDNPMRAAVWTLMRSILSPHLRELNAPSFVFDEELATTVDLAAARGESDLDDLDLLVDEDAEAAEAA